MLEQLRRPFFIASLACLALALVVELGSSALLGQGGLADQLDLPTPGYGVPYLALLDGLLLLTVSLIALALLLPERIHGRAQGIVTLVASILFLLGAIVAAIASLIALILMVSLFLAPIFGTIAYMAMFSHFDRSGAAVALSMAMFLKILFALFLVLGHQRFLQNKSLVLVTLTSLIATWLVGFLQAFPPGILASITDALAGLVVAILAIIWAILYLLFSIFSVIRVLRVDRATG
jgi:VanZ family protein